MRPDKKEQVFERLSVKDMDHQFCQRIEYGMGCSPFISEAITKVVKEVYFPLIHSSENILPGQISFQCISSKCGASVPIKKAALVSVILTLDAGQEDQGIRKKLGVNGLRQHRICRLCEESYEQGGLLTVEDLAYRLLNVGERTITRDLAAIRKNLKNPPLRSTVKDIGRTISHRALLIKNWLKGDELSELKRKYQHSYSAIENYINTFKRVIQLEGDGYTPEKIGYMLKISSSLSETYKDLWKENKSKTLPHRQKEILGGLKNVVSQRKKKKRSKV